MEEAKEFFDAITTRIRSHFYSSVALSFIAFNWQEIFFLLNSEMTVLDRIACAEETLQYLWPLGVGIVLAILAPYAALVGTWTAKFAVERIRLQEAGTDKNVKVKKFNWIAEEAFAEKRASNAETEAAAAATETANARHEKQKAEGRVRTRDKRTGENLAWKENFGNFEDYLASLKLSTQHKKVIKNLYESESKVIVRGEFEEQRSFLIDDNVFNERGIENIATIGELLERNLLKSLTPHATFVKIFKLTDDGEAVASWLISE